MLYERINLLKTGWNIFTGDKAEDTVTRILESKAEIKDMIIKTIEDFSGGKSPLSKEEVPLIFRSIEVCLNNLNRGNLHDVMERLARDLGKLGFEEIVFEEDFSEMLENDLHTAVKQGDAQKVKRLIDMGADVNIMLFEDYVSFLIYAAAKGYKDVVKELINRKADINKTDKNGYTALMRAAVAGHAVCVDILVKAGANINITDKKGITALMLAVKHGHHDAIRQLIRGKADINLRDAEGNAALHYAITKNDTSRDTYTLKTLIKYGLTEGTLDLNIRDKEKKTPLIKAVLGKDIAIVSYLIMAGADLNIQDNRGMSALMYACTQQSIKIIEEILGCIKYVDAYEYYANKSSFINSLVFSGNDSEQMQIPFGLDLEARDCDKETALMKAVKYGSVDSRIFVVSMLIKAGARVNIKDKEGKTALKHAKNCYNKDVFWALHRAGAQEKFWKRITKRLFGRFLKDDD